MSHVWNNQFRHFSIMSHTTLIPLISHIHANTTYLLNITCTLVATNVILERSECTHIVFSIVELLTLNRSAVYHYRPGYSTTFA